MARKLLALAALILASGWAVTGLAGDNGKGDGVKKAPYMHVVIFYVKKDAPDGAAKAIVDDSHKLLAKIPSVRHLWVGPPAKEATPKVAVTDYAVGLTIAFEDAAGLKTYLDHDLHQKFVKKHTEHIEKVLVYDFVNQGK